MVLKKIKSMAVLAVFLMVLGCSHTSNIGKGAESSVGAPRAEDAYASEILRLKKIVSKSPNSQQAKKAHLKMARLYLNHNNYRRNYRKAHEHMQAYRRLEKGVTDEQTHNWIAVLREIELLSEELENRNRQMIQIQGELEKAKREKGSIKQSHRQLVQMEMELREENSRLEAHNQKLRQNIEMLKRLDRRLEEKRRHLTN